MFAQKGGDDSKARVPSSLELNKHYRDSNMLHQEVRQDINFSSYLELLRLKGGSHGQRQSEG